MIIKAIYNRIDYITGEIISNGVSNECTKVHFTENANDSSEQLQILYDVRVREVHRLTELIDSMQKEHEIGIKKFQNQLALQQAEIERSNISQKHLQSLLVESKQDLEKFQKLVCDLEKENKDLEASKNSISNELETAKLTINDLERKVIVLEKGNKSSCEAVQYELNLKSIVEKHNVELENFNKEHQKILKTNEDLNKENTDLRFKLNQLRQANDENLAAKSEIINRLSKQIDETQKQCESLLKSSTAEENLRLQMELKFLRDEKSQITSKLDALEKENSRQEEEIKQYESLSKISFNNSFTDSKELDSSEFSGKLGAELFRALNGQKEKRQEIKNLQAQLESKNEQILQLTENEKTLKYEYAKVKVIFINKGFIFI